MNRKESNTALGNIETLDYGSDYGYEGNAICDLIDKIYDDFESMTCENCKYVGYRKSDNESYCILNNTTYRDPVANDFGCNRFERKDNE